MKICLISSRFYPQLVGSGTSAFTIANGLASRGHTVTALVDAGMRNEARHGNLPFTVKYIESLESFAMGKSSFREPIQDIYKHLLQIQPDILHVCNFMPMLLVTMIHAKLPCPVAFSFFNTPDIGKRAVGYFVDSDLDINLASFVIKNNAYHTLILGSRHYVTAAVALGAHQKKIRLSYLPADINFCNTTSSCDGFKKICAKYFRNEDLDHPYILLPSRITKQKGILEAIEALAIINRKTMRKHTLLLTGMASPFDHAYAQSVQHKARQLNVHTHLLVPNQTIDRNDLAAFFRAASLVLIPSWYEGFGLSAVEAQYLGAPLAVSDTQGLNEIVSDGENGVLFTPKDSDSMADAALRVLHRKVNVNALVSNAKHTVKKFSLENHISDIEDCYRNIATQQTV